MAEIMLTKGRWQLQRAATRQYLVVDKTTEIVYARFRSYHFARETLEELNQHDIVAKAASERGKA